MRASLTREYHVDCYDDAHDGILVGRVGYGCLSIARECVAVTAMMMMTYYYNRTTSIRMLLSSASIILTAIMMI